MEAVGRWFRACVRRVVQAGPIPRHAAFIMDGNRRFADKRHISRGSGHLAGYKTMIDSLEWCLDLGITCVSVYAFSIENFKRSPEEVECLMGMAAEKLDMILQERELVDRHGVRVMVLGDLSLLPPGVQRAAARVMHATRHNSRGTLNICLSYTSRHEMAHAVGTVRRAVSEGRLHPTDVSAAVLERCLYTGRCPPVDVLIRTSGETRLSDFLLWQSSHALLVFTDVMWPELSFWDLVRAVVEYQRHCQGQGRAPAGGSGGGGSERDKARPGAAIGAAAAAAAAGTLHVYRALNGELVEGAGGAGWGGAPSGGAAAGGSAERGPRRSKRLMSGAAAGAAGAQEQEGRGAAGAAIGAAGGLAGGAVDALSAARVEAFLQGVEQGVLDWSARVAASS